MNWEISLETYNINNRFLIQSEHFSNLNTGLNMYYHKSANDLKDSSLIKYAISNQNLSYLWISWFVGVNELRDTTKQLEWSLEDH